MKTAISAKLKIPGIGALAFWIPDTITHAIWRYSFDSPQVWLLTAIQPLTLTAVWVAYAKLTNSRLSATASRMLLGVWLLGGAFMTLDFSFAGGGFASADGLRGGFLLIAASLVPIVTYMMAVYDGSLFALLFVTVLLFLAWISKLDGVRTAVRTAVDGQRQ